MSRRRAIGRWGHSSSSFVRAMDLTRPPGPCAHSWCPAGPTDVASPRNILLGGGESCSRFAIWAEWPYSSSDHLHVGDTRIRKSRNIDTGPAVVRHPGTCATDTAWLHDATWGLFKKAGWWERVAIASAVLGLVVLIPYWIAAHNRGETTPWFTVLIHAVGAIGVLASCWFPPWRAGSMVTSCEVPEQMAD